jgi:hypothetical protein
MMLHGSDKTRDQASTMIYACSYRVRVITTDECPRKLAIGVDEHPRYAKQKKKDIKIIARDNGAKGHICPKFLFFSIPFPPESGLGP